MTPVIAHASLAASLSIELVKQAGSAPEDATLALLEGASDWAKIAQQLATPIVKPDLNCSDKVGAELAKEYSACGVTWGLSEPAGIRRWKFNGELLGMPPGFLEAIAQAKRVELVFGAANGGDGRVAGAMIDALRARGVPVHGHVEKHAASAHADLFVLGCTHRTMRRRAKVMLHPSHMVGFGTAETLHRHAEALREWDRQRALDYAARTGQPLELVSRWVRDGKEKNYWFPAKRAVASGLADEVT